MAVWQNKQGKWVVDFYPHGRSGRHVRRVLPPEVAADEAQAREYEARARAAIKRQARGAAGRTIKDLHRRYLRWVEANQSEKTWKDKKNVFKNHVVPMMGRVRVDEIAPHHFAEYKEARLRQGAANNAVNKEVSYARGFFGYLADELGMIDPLPFRTSRLPYKRPVPKVMDEDTVRKLLDAMEPLYQAYFLLLYGAGLRANEARMLRVEDVDLKKKTIRVRQKGDNVRVLPVDGWPLHALESVIDGRGGGWVFQSKTKPDTPIWFGRYALKEARKKAGIPDDRRIHPHLFRHSIATRMVEEGVDIRVIQEFLGHSSVTMTQWYAQVQPEVLRGKVLTINTRK